MIYLQIPNIIGVTMLFKQNLEKKFFLISSLLNLFCNALSKNLMAKKNCYDKSY